MTWDNLVRYWRCEVDAWLAQLSDAELEQTIEELQSGAQLPEVVELIGKVQQRLNNRRKMNDRGPSLLGT
jgi:hypothetical protein